MLGEVAANLGKVETAVTVSAGNGAEVVVLPELVTTGYVFESAQEARGLAERIDGPSLRAITALAAALKRDPKSVRRDVLKLERAGVVRTRQQINPGHGRVKIVEPVALEYRLTAVL